MEGNADCWTIYSHYYYQIKLEFDFQKNFHLGTISCSIRSSGSFIRAIELAMLPNTTIHDYSRHFFSYSGSWNYFHLARLSRCSGSISFRKRAGFTDYFHEMKFERPSDQIVSSMVSFFPLYHHSLICPQKKHARLRFQLFRSFAHLVLQSFSPCGAWPLHPNFEPYGWLLSRPSFRFH